MQFINNIKAIMLKVLIFRKKHWFLTILEIVVPCSAIGFMLYSRRHTGRSTSVSSTPETSNSVIPIQQPEQPSAFQLDIKCFDKFDSAVSKVVITYSPPNELIEEIMELIKEEIIFLKGSSQVNKPNIEFKLMENEQEIEDYFESFKSRKGGNFPKIYFYGIVFNLTTKIFQYKIRIGRLAGIKTYLEKIYPSSNSYYKKYCFSVLQRLIDHFFVETVHSRNTLLYNYKTPQIFMNEFNGQEFQSDDTNPPDNDKLYTPLIVLIGFLIVLPVTIATIVEEKATGTKELMKLMGLNSEMSWLCWLINANVITVIVNTITTILLTMEFFKGIPPILPHTNAILLWLLLFLFSNSVTIYLFVICAIFHHPLVAISMALILYFVPTFLFEYEAVAQYLHSKNLSWLPWLLPPKAMFDGFQFVFYLAEVGTGIQFGNLFHTSSFGKAELSDEMYQNLQFGVVLLVLLLDIIVYAIITWYIDKVRPGPYGRAKPWYFICCFCFKRGRGVKTVGDIDEPTYTTYFQKPPECLNVRLYIRKLTKIFPQHTNAVERLNIDIYDRKITALLGHKGAGKTSIISMITGMFSQTYGTVHETITHAGEKINIFENLDKYRQNLGLCPQRNMLFSYFTVTEHFKFFGLLKGLSQEKVKAYREKIMKMLNIPQEEKNMKLHKLSDVNQRKISFAISLIGSPTILVLDEFTSGMDPKSRKKMWNTLLSLRKGRTIIIATKCTEEAEALGDYIVIMDHGKLQFYGTLVFLRKVYGVGYKLVLYISPKANVKRITKFVTSLLRGIVLLKSIDLERIVFSLPQEHLSHFANPLAKLEMKMPSLKIKNIKVMSTTLKDVFLKVGKLSKTKGTEEPSEATSSEISLSSREIPTIEIPSSMEKVTGIELCIAQFWMLILKKIRFTYRTIFSHIVFTLTVLTLLIMVLQPSVKKKEDSNPLNVKIDIDLRESGEVLVTYTQEMFIFATIYESLVTTSDVSLLPNKSIASELHDISQNETRRNQFRTDVAVDWKKDVVTGFYSKYGRHSLPISLNLITNTLVKYYNDNYSIVVYNHPFREHLKSPCSFDTVYEIPMALPWALLLPLGLLFVMAYFITYPLHERVTGIKHLQLMTGVSPICYWLASFIIDYSMFLLTLLILIIIVSIIHSFWRIRIMYTDEFAFIYFMVTSLYGVSAIPFAYFFTFFKKTSVGASAYFIFFNLFFSLAFFSVFMVLFVIVIQLKRKLPIEFLIIQYILMLNPYYCYSWIIFKFMLYCQRKILCKICYDDFSSTHYSLDVIDETLNCDNLQLLGFGNNFFNPEIGILLIILFINSIFYTIIILLIDYRIIGKNARFRKRRFIEKNYKDDEYDEIDDDILGEFDRVDEVLSDMLKDESNLQVHPVLVVDNLEKKYKRKIRAVKGVSFAIESGECFGLLGINGAGKTTTVKMLVGEVIPSHGDAIINKYSLFSERYKYLQQIGYCPQFNALNERMTGRELIYLFGRLRGIRRADCGYVTDYWLKYLGLDEYSNKFCRNYGSGNKRKLSTAMALIGNPVIVFLDEPTNGLDPAARRALWDVLVNCQKSGQSIVITSDSIDECEALCSRLTIMDHGQLMCIGNIEYLKTKFAQGFTIAVTLPIIEDPNNVLLDNLKRDIETTFGPYCDLKNQHETLLEYHVADTSKTHSSIFTSMDRIKRNNSLIVEDYTIRDTTLEEVFLTFKKKSIELT